MKLSLLLFALALPVHAAEVYFDTVSTAKATRLHGAYVGAYAGSSRLSDATTGPRLKGQNIGNDSGWIAGVKFGYAFETPLPIRPALELELFHLTSGVSASKSGGNQYTGDIKANGAMLNAAVGFDLGGADDSFLSKLRPYVGAGTGLAYASVKGVNLKLDGRNVHNADDGGQVSFGYQVFGGLEYAASDELSFFAEYKYLNLYDLGSGDIQGAELSLYTLGMRFLY